MTTSNYQSIVLDSNLPMRMVHIDTKDEKSPYMEILADADLNTKHFIPPHWHRSIEFTYIKQGSATLRMGSVVKKYGPGDLYLINSGDVHELSNTPGEHLDVICFIISYDYCKAIDPNFDSYRLDINKTNDTHKQFKTIFQSIIDIYYMNDPHGYILIRAELDKLMYYLLKYHSVEQKKVLTNQTEDYLEMSHKDLLEYIHGNYEKPLTLDYVSTKFFMSREHFSRTFKEIIGQTFLEYLIDYRIHKAFSDIVGTNETMEEISVKHGFPSSKGMITQFKKRYGETPNEYRKKSKTSIVDHGNE